MRIMSVSAADSNQPAFGAYLSIKPGAWKAIKGESRCRFDEVMSKLREKLLEESSNDVFVVGKSWMRPKVGPYGEDKANLKVAIKSDSAHFYYDRSRSIPELVEDLYNAYKHVLRKHNRDIPEDTYDEFVNKYQAMMP